MNITKTDKQWSERLKWPNLTKIEQKWRKLTDNSKLCNNPKPVSSSKTAPNRQTIQTWWIGWNRQSVQNGPKVWNWKQWYQSAKITGYNLIQTWTKSIRNDIATIPKLIEEPYLTNSPTLKKKEKQSVINSQKWIVVGEGAKIFSRVDWFVNEPKMADSSNRNTRPPRISVMWASECTLQPGFHAFIRFCCWLLHSFLNSSWA